MAEDKYVPWAITLLVGVIAPIYIGRGPPCRKNCREPTVIISLTGWLGVFLVGDKEVHYPYYYYEISHCFWSPS